MGVSHGLFGGLMSGTSLDGVDVAILEIRGDDPASVQWSLAAFLSLPYEPAERARIREAIGSGTSHDLALLDRDLGRRFAQSFRTLLDRTGIEAESMVAVGSHGQTVWHEPPERGVPGATLQLGDPSLIAEEIGCDVVGDFRSRDVAAGGHGAPLVPWADWVMLRRPGIGRALQNLGGMGNVTFLPRDGDSGGVRGFDTGPGVALLDRAANLASGGAEAWDREGRRAGAGTVDSDLLAALLRDSFFGEAPPRSTGRERFGDARLREIVDELRPDSDAAWNDLLATLVELTARSVAMAYEGFLPPGGIDEIVLAGGGARNPTLVQALRWALRPLPVKTGADALGIDPDAREAAAFALLAWARLNEVPGNLPAVTGARGPRVLGSLHAGGRSRG